MHPLRFAILVPVVCTVLLGGCGGEFARIDGLPATRDMTDVPWPRLVDTPAAPQDTLLPATGTAALAALNDTRRSVMTRAALPGPQRVAVAELGGRVARIRQQSAVREPGVDAGDLAARSARLAQGRAVPVTALSADELQARAGRITTMRARGADTVAAQDLRLRGERVAAARTQISGGLDEATLNARADRVKAQAGVYGTTVDRADLAQRAQRISASTVAVARPAPPTFPVRRAVPAEPPPPLPPRPRPARPPVDRTTPVISDDFRKRAEEARRRARERAATGSE